MGRRRTVGSVISLAAAVLMLGLASTAALGSAPSVVTFEGATYHGKGLQVRPRLIVMSGDGSAFLAGRGRAGRHPHVGRLRWTTWNGAEGKGWGALWVDNCTPDCVHGRRIPYRVNLEVSRPEVEHGYDLFTRMKLTFLGKPAFPNKQTQVYKLRSQSSAFFWG